MSLGRPLGSGRVGSLDRIRDSAPASVMGFAMTQGAF